MVAALIEKYYLKMLKMKNIVSIGLFATLLLISCLGQEDDDFTALFDGRNLDEWIPGPEGGFEIINGELYTGGEEGNDLFTKKWYCNYVLRVEYMLSDVGNSGVLIRCNPEAAWETGVEVQLLAPWTPWRDDLHCTGSLYGHVAVANRPDETTGIWHKMEIKCDRHTIRVSVDDSMTTLAKIDTVITMADKLICGAIGLQVNHAEKEGQYAKFRNIYIRDLDAEPEPAPEQPEGGVLLSKPCTDSPDLLMAEMRIFNGVNPGEPMKYGVLDPSILCWLLDCVSSRYKDMRCSKELAYAWGDMEEIKIHILRDGRVRMRRARSAEHALASFKIIERTVMGAIICNCCGRDLLTVLTGFVKSAGEYHSVLDAGSTVSLNKELVDWTPEEKIVDTKPISQMVDLIDVLYSELVIRLDLLIKGEHPSDNASETRLKICKIISLMVDPMNQGTEAVFLRGLTLAFFIDGAMIGLRSLNQLINDQLTNLDFVVNLLRAAKKRSLQNYETESLSESEILPIAHINRVERALRLYDLWKKK